MVRRVGIWAIGAVLGLLILGSVASYHRAFGVQIPGGGLLVLDSGTIWYGEFDVLAAPARPPTTRWILPLWMPLALFALVFWFVWRIGRQRRQAALAGHCPTCRYDLTGLDGVCPECGNSQ